MPLTRLTALLLLSVAPLSATAQTKVAATAPATQAQTVEAARKEIADRYVLPDVGQKLAAVLAKNEADGRYRGLTGEALAAKMTVDLAAVAHDKHLSVTYNPEMAARMGAEPMKDDGPMPPAFARMMDRDNGGVASLQVFPGNIRYMEYNGFEWGTPGVEEALATAMRFLKGGDAIIIDVRRNGGGSPEAVAAIVSYFLPAGTKLMDFEMRGMPAQTSTTSATPFSLAGKPLYVLTSGGSASATEEFATHVSAFGFGTLVGENTAGAAYRNDVGPLPGGYLLSVSVGRPVHAKTHGDWEGKGVAPGIASSFDAALPRAKAEAMAAIAAKAPADERAEDTRMLAFYRAAATPVTPALPLAAYAGHYGERTISVRDGALYNQRLTRPASRLLALTPDSFAPELDPATQIRFVIDGRRVTAMEVSRAGQPADRIARDSK